LTDQARQGQSVAVLDAGNRVLHDVENLETGQRGYLLTADSGYLERYQRGRHDLDDTVLLLKELVVNDPRSATLVERIEQVNNKNVTEVSEPLGLARSGNHTAALAQVRTNEGKHYMDGFLTLLCRTDSASYPDFLLPE
jgi:CHASE3 domain sensor protein